LHADGEYVIGRETHWRPRDVGCCAHEQTRGGEQHDRERQLDDDERLTQAFAAARAPRRPRANAVAKLVGQLGDGKKYGLRSTKIALSKHVGHTVTVVGTAYKEDEDEKAENTKASEEAADLRVTSLTMVSATCE
jgi:hypothetical protein